MRDINTVYSEIGASIDNALETFGEIELVAHFAERFASEPSFSELQKAIETGDYNEAFRHVHGMKSLTGSLGFLDLYDRVCALTEILRPGFEERRVDTDINEAYESLKAEYNKVVDALK